ncbi:MAG TPA: hydratase, partial [Deltaproteobacteria bacterium]|nr:hydratase [Deltaproteobacteria bacterium]
MDSSETEEAARMIWGAWSAGEVIPELPEGCRPLNELEGHQVQAALTRIARQDTEGWKIAAT